MDQETAQKSVKRVFPEVDSTYLYDNGSNLYREIIKIRKPYVDAETGEFVEWKTPITVKVEICMEAASFAKAQAFIWKATGWVEAANLSRSEIDEIASSAKREYRGRPMDRFSMRNAMIIDALMLQVYAIHGLEMPFDPILDSLANPPLGDDDAPVEG